MVTKQGARTAVVSQFRAPGQVQVVAAAVGALSSCPSLAPPRSGPLLSAAPHRCQQRPTAVIKWLGLAPSPDSLSSSASIECCSLSLRFPICEMATMAASQGIVDSVGGGTQLSSTAQHRWSPRPPTGLQEPSKVGVGVVMC